MSSPRIIRTRVAALTLNIDALNAQLRTALTTITQTARQHDGYPTTASGAAPGPTGGKAELTSVESAAHHNLGDLTNNGNRYHPGPITALADLDELIHGANDLVTRAINILNKHHPTPASPTRCDGRTYDGYDQWGDPTCTRPADKAGLSSDCYMRCYRWRRDNGLPPLRDSAA